jgi:ribose-phosphate pyrophosphokinase
MEQLSTLSTRIITFDLHASQEVGFTQKRMPFNNLYCKPLFCKYIKENLFGDMTKEECRNNFVMVAPDCGASKTASAYAESLDLIHKVCVKERDYTKINVVTKCTLTGDPNDVRDKTILIVDDIADTCGTLVSCVNELKTFGIKDAIVFVSHGLFSNGALERINNCPHISKVIVSNTTPQEEHITKSSKLEVVDISPILSEVIRRTFTTESISELFS